ncbi:hypothetical protein [Sporosarcina trichiuri]|uniref:hypothetical protein n=1 Tax=Sporosarcina trichiuri TaxID=3056445 RepID=UPI0025B4A795|nr:hypothetical protein [Sporosarcina sp. 0.2-SM1T-5]WJY27277.1 hypothetical protein QWT68_14745 [Sporosarcina sp. 0.2-SM1T-5]
MTRYTDDELNRELENLRKPFEPTPARKRAMRQAVFSAKQPSPAKRILHWQPLLVSFILLIGIISATTVLIGKPGASVNGWFAKDVTDSWSGMIMEQTSRNDVISYYIVFQENNLHIENTNVSETFMGNVNITQAEAEKMAEEHQAKLAKLTMQPGDYPDYTVKKKNDLYTITIPGENGFSYTLEKTAPRQFTGEDGITYSVNNYTE